METDAEKLRFIEEMTANVDAVQERVLAEILGRNAERLYIRRIAEGDRSPILSGSKHPISEFLTSSGTSARERKLLPTVEDEIDRRKLLSSLAMSVINRTGSRSLPISRLVCSNHRVTDPSARKEVGDILRADLELARCIRTECSPRKIGQVFITRIWPNTKYLETIVTGSMAQYIPTLNYYSGGLPMASIAYASSECYFGLNLRPFCDPSEVSYTIMPTWHTWHTLSSSLWMVTETDLARVEVGREYEIVITNHSGLNRYRVGDILRVTGFHNMAPQFSFVRRRNVLLSVESDKNDEAELQRAVERASSLLCTFDAAVLDYTSQACTKSIPGHYVIYWELLLTTKGSHTMIDDETLEKCCLEMEEALNAVYRQSRVADASIGPLEIRVVKAGTFEKLMDYAISHGTSIAQYKVPRCVTLPPVIELLDSHVISCHFSPKLPHWASAGQQLDSTKEEYTWPSGSD
ncbi:hypothetical protein QOZ80_9BG0697520 [Eleusine coracana subsp. coracana]|nr:hypothetical protein QOZ80_9BG0697520 [Eleusine coracana subsp. coracana]